MYNYPLKYLSHSCTYWKNKNKGAWVHVYLTSHLVMVCINVVQGQIPQPYTVYILLYCLISAYKLERIWCNMFHSRCLQQNQKCVCYSNWRQVLLESHLQQCKRTLFWTVSRILYIIIFTYSSWLSSKYPDDSTDPACNLHHFFQKQKEWNSSEFRYREGW